MSKPKKPKAKKTTEAKGAAAQPRSARIYQVVESKAAAAEKLTSKQALAVYGVLARNKAGLTAEQVLEKLSGNEKFVSKNPASVLAAVLYDLRKGTGVCTKVGPGLVEIVGKPEAAHAEKKAKGKKPKGAKAEPTQPAPTPTPAA